MTNVGQLLVSQEVINKVGKDVNQMKQVFNCQKHPKFTMGKLTESQMFYLYLKNFNHQVKMAVTKKVRILLL